VFTLEPGSPAIDQGMIFGAHPYHGAAPDIGAHETNF